MSSPDFQKQFRARLHQLASEHAFLAPLVAPIIWLLMLMSALLLPAKIASEDPKVSEEQQNKTPSLFPSISNVAIAEEDAEAEKAEATRPTPCSTGITTRLLPYKNAKGEIEWAFTEDLPPGSELDAFRIQSEPPKSVKKEAEDILSPVTSSSSNNDSIVYDKNGAEQINTPSSTASEDDKGSGKEDDDNDTGAGESADGQLHQCPHCNTSFRMRGYLTRHIKKHASEKAYRCPFHKSSIYKDDNGVVHQCHPTGGFSRRDTYKTHLKSRHFKYPDNTPIKARNSSAGNCSMCGEWFENGEVWCEIHIEGGECKHLPPGFKGKSRIKNRLRKELARMMKEQKKTKGKTPRSAVPKTQSPVLGTPNSMTTPMPPTTSTYDYNDSPTSISSYMTSQQSGFSKSQSVKQESPEMLTVTPHLPEVQASPDDYGDDFCLDTEQLNLPIPTPDMFVMQQAELSQFMSPMEGFTPAPPMASHPMPQPMPQVMYEQRPPQKAPQHHIPKHIRTQMQMQMPMGFQGDEHMIREKGY